MGPLLYICAVSVLIWLHGFWSGRRFDETAERVRYRLGLRIEELETYIRALQEELRYQREKDKRQ